LPDFKADVESKVTKTGMVHTNGYVSTINVEEFRTGRLDNCDRIKLRKEQTGFLEDFKLCAKWQPGKAPLAVIVVGLFSKADDKLAQHWQRMLYDTGCHVLCTDSLFRHDVTKRTGMGIPGNPKVEAEVLARVVNAVMDYRGEDGDREPVRPLISSVRLLGTSYGGEVALHLAMTNSARQWPVDRCLLLSVPVSMHSTAQAMDRFIKEDRPKFELSLFKLLDGYTPEHDPPTAKEESLIRAGIAYYFQAGLEDVINESEKRYMKGYRDRLKAEEEAEEARAGRPPAKKMSDWGNWNYNDFVELMAAPYWKTTAEELWKQGDLATLLADAPAYTQVVVSADDPLDKPEDLAALKARYSEPKLIVLPHGGHMGYCATRWLKALIEKTFKPNNE
jgi:predicted alpha/beta-fold hydrolase